MNMFPVLVVSSNKDFISVLNTPNEMAVLESTVEIKEENVELKELTFGDITVHVSDSGYVFAHQKERIGDYYESEESTYVNISENFALSSLVNILPLETVVDLLVNGWGFIGKQEDVGRVYLSAGDNSSRGFFGPLN